MVKSIVGEHHWPPEIIGGLFIDGEDYEGLVYWYNTMEQQIKEMKTKKK